MGKLVADIIVETLQSAGVEHCYGVVGDTLNLIARSLEKREATSGNGEGEFPLVQALLCLTEAQRHGGVAV
jgi:hypothetical protein